VYLFCWWIILAVYVCAYRHINVGAQFQATLPPVNGNFFLSCYCLVVIVGYYAILGGGIKRYRDLAICPSPRCAAAVGYRHAGCLQLSRVQTADPSADRRRSAASRTTIGVSWRCPRGNNLFVISQVKVYFVEIDVHEVC